MPTTQTPRAPMRSWTMAGFWITDHAWLWNVVDDFGNCVPVEPDMLSAWIGWPE